MSNDLTLAIEVQMQAQQAMAQVQALAGTISQLGRGLDDAGSKGNAAGESMFASMIKAQVVMEGVKRAMEGLNALFAGTIEKGIEFNSVMAGSSLGVSALIATQMDLKDANGQALTGQAALGASMELGAKQMNDLRLGSFKTIATVQELTAAYQQGLGPMLAAGIGLEDTTKLTVKMAQAAGALNLDISTLGHELRTTFSGEISPRMAKIASSLHITNEDISAWKEAGTLVQEMNKRLEMFSLAGDQVERSWRGVTSNLRHAAEAGAGEMVLPLFDALRTSLYEALKEVFDTSTGNFAEAFQGILDVAKDTFGALGEVATKGIRTALDTLTAFSGWLEDNRKEVQGFVSVAGTLAAVVGTVLGGAFSIVTEILGLFITTVGKFPVLFTAVLGAVAAMTLGLALDSVAWNALAISIIDAGFAAEAFLASIGPIGWTIGIVGALVGTMVSLRSETEKAAKAEVDHANAIKKTYEETVVLQERLQALSERLKDHTLKLGERKKAEEETREVLDKLKRAGDEYLRGIDLEKMSLEQLAETLEKVIGKRKSDFEATKQQVISQKAAAEAALNEAKAALTRLEGDKTVPAEHKDLASGVLNGIIQARQAEFDRLNALIKAYGETDSRTLDQKRERLSQVTAELEKLKKAQVAAEKAPGGEEATQAYNRRMKEIEELTKEEAKLRKETGIEAKSRPLPVEGGGKSAALKALEQEIALDDQRLKGLPRITLEEQEQAQLAQIALQAKKDMAKVMAETEKTDKDKLGAGPAGQRRDAITAAESAQDLATRKEFADKRRAMEEALQEGLTSQEEGGLAKRLAAVAKQFVNLRKMNETLGRPHSEEEIGSAEGAAKERARQEQIKADLTKLKQELAELGQTQGPLTRGEIAEKLDQFTKKSAEAKAAVAKLSQEMHLNGTAGQGWAMGMKSYLAESTSAFHAWQNAALQIMKGVESSMATALGSIVQHGQTAGQKWDALWHGMSGAAVQAISTIMAKEAAAWIAKQAKSAWDALDSTKTITEGEQEAINAAEVGGAVATSEGVQAGATVAGSVAEMNANVMKAGVMKSATLAAIDLAAAETWAAYAAIPFLGEGLAIAQLAVMGGSLAGVSAAAAGTIVAHAVGGVIDRPTLALMGEAGTEVVAPETSFKDYTAKVFSMGSNLMRNLMGADNQVLAYQSAAAGYTLDGPHGAFGGGARSGSSGASGGGGGTVVIGRGAMEGAFKGALIMDTSRAGMGRAGNFMLDGLQHAAKSRGVILTQGNVLGGV